MIEFFALAGLAVALIGARENGQRQKKNSWPTETCAVDCFPIRNRLEYEILREGMLLGEEQLSTPSLLVHLCHTDPQVSPSGQRFSAQMLTIRDLRRGSTLRRRVETFVEELYSQRYAGFYLPQRVLYGDDTVVLLYPPWSGRTAANWSLEVDGDPFVKWKNLLLAFSLFEQKKWPQEAFVASQIPLDERGEPCLFPSWTRPPYQSFQISLAKMWRPLLLSRFGRSGMPTSVDKVLTAMRTGKLYGSVNEAVGELHAAVAAHLE